MTKETSMQKFLLLAVLATSLGGCVGGSGVPGTGGGGGYSGGETQAESQAKSGETKPGETQGPEGTMDDGSGAGFGPISG
ncbi:MAG: hypothetical protein ACK4SL_00455 [Candidatus Paceibacteria bacterium]